MERWGFPRVAPPLVRPGALATRSMVHEWMSRKDSTRDGNVSAIRTREGATQIHI